MPTYTIRDRETGITVQITQDAPPTSRQIRRRIAEEQSAGESGVEGVEPETSFDLSRLSSPPMQELMSNNKPITRDRAADMAEWVGGGLGGVIGGVGGTAFGMGFGGMPGAVGGAALGGAAGRGVGEVIRNSDDLLPALREVAQRLRDEDTSVATRTGISQGIGEGGVGAVGSAARQGALEFGGGLTARALASMARGAMNNALRPGWRVVRDKAGKVIQNSHIPGVGTGKVLTNQGSLQSRFPQVPIVQEALDRGLPIRSSGAAISSAHVDRLSSQVDEAIKSAMQRGNTVDADLVVEPLINEWRRRAPVAGSSSREMTSFMREIDEIFDALPGDRIPIDLAQLKKKYYAKVAEDMLATGEGPMRELAAKVARGGLQEGIEQAVDSGRAAGEPSLRNVNKEVQTWMALNEALTTALDRESRSSRYTFAGLLDNPQLWGAVGHGLNIGSRSGARIPIPIRALALAYLASDPRYQDRIMMDEPPAAQGGPGPNTGVGGQ